MTSVHSAHNAASSPAKSWQSSTYPKPPPLAERSASQRNIQSLRKLHPAFGKTLFPKLPHNSRANIVHVFEDEVQHASHDSPSAVHPGPLFRQEQSHVGAYGHVSQGKENESSAYIPKSNVYAFSPASMPPYPEPEWPELPALDVAADNLRLDVDDPFTPRSQMMEMPKSGYDGRNAFPPSSAGTKTPRLSLGSTIGRVRSLSTSSTTSYGLFPHLPEDFAATIAAAMSALGRSTSSSTPRERPRSCSTPVGPSESLFQNTIDPTPPGTTETMTDRAEEDTWPLVTRGLFDQDSSIGMSTGRAAQPQQQSHQLQRKHVNPQPSNGAPPFRGPPHAYSSLSPVGQKQYRLNSNQAGFSGRHGAVSPVVEESYPHNGPHPRVAHSSRNSSSARNSNWSRHGSGSHSGRLSPRPNNARHGSGVHGGRVSPRPGHSSRYASSSRTMSTSRNGSSFKSRVPSNGFGPRNGSFARNQFNPQHDTDYEEWPEEFGEAVPEMNFMPAAKAFTIESRPSTSSSHRSGRGSLYKFLNDSYTSWAKVYYRNEEALHHELPPPVAQVGNFVSPPQSRVNSRHPSVGPQTLQVPHGGRLPMSHGQHSQMGQHYQPGRMPPRAYSQCTTATNFSDISRAPRAPPPSRHFRPLQTGDSFTSIDSRFSQPTMASGISTMSRAPQKPPFMMGEQLPSTPEDHPEVPMNASQANEKESPGSAGFPDTVYVPRIRPMQQRPESVASTEKEGSAADLAEGQTSNNLPSPRESSQVAPEISRFSEDRQSSVQDPTWRQPTDNKDMGIFGIINRQILLFCIGFLCPLAWFIAAILRIPARPEMRMMGHEEYVNTAGVSMDLFDSMAVVRYQKARRWRTTNRIMSVLGVCIIVIIGATAGVATRH